MGGGLGHLAAHMKEFIKKSKFENSANFDENFQI